MFLSKIFGDESTRLLKSYQPLVERINGLESVVSALTDDEMRAKTTELKGRYREGESLDSLLPEAFALVREASRRTLGQRHYDVQLIGGMIMHFGNIAEMKTGEGKTLVATLPAFLNAIAGRGVHVVTVNDYLSRRDAVWMGPIYSFLGLTIGVINQDASYLYDPSHQELVEVRDELASFKVFHEFLRPSPKKESYAADITYGTNNEFGFDYLRDNIAYSSQAVVQRDYAYAIVDEIDSILIDEARTPLIISAPSEDAEDLYQQFAKIAEGLVVDEDFTVDEKLKAISLTDSGIEKTERILNIDNIYTEKGVKYVHHLENAVRAKALFERDTAYVVRNDEVVIVDEFTGRLQPGRRWSEGLHQAIEAKEGVRVQQESRTVASITFQNYFRMYDKLSGMTGTAVTSTEEFYKVYGLNVVVVPPNRALARRDYNDLIFQTEQGKFKAVARKVKELHDKGQPVLVGTVSIEKNELLSAYLSTVGIPHQVLNAKNHENEAEVIAQAGVRGRVTIATNMAGRGVDVTLSGNPPDKKVQEEIRALGGLFVIGTERHEARRIDNQLRGRSGRQGDPGETQFFVSFEDTLMRVFASETIKKMMGRFGIPEDEPIENSIMSRSLETAQTKIEGFNFDARKNVLEYDNVLNHQRQTVYERRRAILFGESGAVRQFLDALTLDHPEYAEMIHGKEAMLGEQEFLAVSARMILQTIDLFWMEHLDSMNYMRSSVNLRAYGQRDPLVEYKREGLNLYKQMQIDINHYVAQLISAIDQQAVEAQALQSVGIKNITLSGGGEGKGDSVLGAGHTHTHSHDHTHGQLAAKNIDGDKIGRNDACPCGSGKKWKKCGELNTEEHQRLSAVSS